MVGDLQEARLGKVIDRFYEAAARPELWRTVLNEASMVLGADGAELFPGPQAGFSPVYSEPVDEAVATGICEGWFASNPRVTRGMPLLEKGAVVTESMIFSHEELERIPFNAEFVNRFGFRGFAAVSVVSDGPASVFLSVERRREQGIFSHREIELLARMAPHLRRAGQIASRLGQARAEGMMDAFDLMNCGGVLINSVEARRASTLGQGGILVVVSSSSGLNSSPAIEKAMEPPAAPTRSDRFAQSSKCGPPPSPLGKLIPDGVL